MHYKVTFYRMGRYIRHGWYATRQQMLDAIEAWEEKYQGNSAHSEAIEDEKI